MVCGFVASKVELSDYKAQISKFDVKEQHYIETIGENGERIVEQEQIILSQEDALKNNLAEIKRLKKLKAQVVINTITKVDSVFIPFALADTIVIDSVAVENLLIVPKSFSLTDEWYSIDGTIQKSGLLLDTLSFNNEMKLTIGSKSVGIFKKPKPIVLVENTNPYINTISMQNIVIKDELKWYEKKTLWLGVGYVAGIGTAILISK